MVKKSPLVTEAGLISDQEYARRLRITSLEGFSSNGVRPLGHSGFILDGEEKVGRHPEDRSTVHPVPMAVSGQVVRVVNFLVDTAEFNIERKELIGDWHGFPIVLVLPQGLGVVESMEEGCIRRVKLFHNPPTQPTDGSEPQKEHYRLQIGAAKDTDKPVGMLEFDESWDAGAELVTTVNVLRDGRRIR